MARLLRVLGDADGAMRECERAVIDAQGSASMRIAAMWRIEIARSLGRLEAFRRAVAESMGVVDPLFVADVLHKVYDDEGSARAIDRAAAGASTAESWCRVAIAFERIGQPASASMAAEHAVGLAPDDPEIRAVAGRLAVAAGEFDRASAQLEQGSQASIDARLLLASVNVWRLDLDRAEALVRGGGQSAGAVALRILGACAHFRGVHTAAVALLDRAVALDRRDHEAHVLRAEARLRLGDSAGAFDDAVLGGEQVDGGSEYVPALILRYLAKQRTTGSARISLASYGEEGAVAAIASLADVDAQALVTGSIDVADALERALTALGGNRSQNITRIVPGRIGARSLSTVRTNPSSRTLSRLAQRCLLATSQDASLGAFDAILARYPAAPISYCYRGEVLLWLGEYGRALEDFQRALEISDTTFWAMIGIASVALFRGDAPGALAECARSFERTGRTGPTLFAIRGEAHFRVGDLESARADLERACRERPTRVGAFVTLALVQIARGNGVEAEKTLAILRSRARCLFHDAARESGVDPPTLTAESPALELVLERALHLLRGNRSSSLVTYFTETGEMRFVPLDEESWGERIDAREISQLRLAVERLTGLRARARA